MLTPITLAESAGQAAMRVVRDEVDTTAPVTGQTIMLMATRAAAAPATITRAVAIKRKAPELIEPVVSGAMALNAAYEIARRRQPRSTFDRTLAGRKARDERIREMAGEGYSDEDIAEAVGLNLETTRAIMNQRLGIKTLSGK